MENNNLIKLCVDTYRGKVVKYSKDDSNSVIRKAFTDICGTDKINRKVFRRHKVDIFEIIEETVSQAIIDGWGNNTFFQQFVEERNLSLGDTNEFYVPDKSLLLVSKFSGNHWNLKRQKANAGTTFLVKPEYHGAKIYDDFARFMSGRIDFDELIQRIKDSYINQIKQEVYTSFMDGSQYLPSRFKNQGSYNKQIILNICQHVSASCGNGDVIIAGTRTALSKLDVEASWISEKMKNERNSNGVVMYWEGYKVLPIEQVHKANTYDFAIDNNRLLILPQNTKPVKVVYEGDTEIQEISDGTRNMDGSMEYTLASKIGVETIFNVLYGTYDFSE